MCVPAAGCRLRTSRPWLTGVNRPGRHVRSGLAAPEGDGEPSVLTWSRNQARPRTLPAHDAGRPPARRRGRDQGRGKARRQVPPALLGPLTLGGGHRPRLQATRPGQRGWRDMNRSSTCARSTTAVRTASEPTSCSAGSPCCSCASPRTAAGTPGRTCAASSRAAAGQLLRARGHLPSAHRTHGLPACHPCAAAVRGAAAPTGAHAGGFLSSAEALSRIDTRRLRASARFFPQTRTFRGLSRGTAAERRSGIRTDGPHSPGRPETPRGRGADLGERCACSAGDSAGEAAGDRASSSLRYDDAMTNVDIGKEIDRLVSLIVAEVHPLRVVLFGSAARGGMTADSDIDLLVVVPDGTHRLHTMQQLYGRIRASPSRSYRGGHRFGHPCARRHARSRLPRCVARRQGTVCRVTPTTHSVGWLRHAATWRRLVPGG